MMRTRAAVRLLGGFLCVALLTSVVGCSSAQQAQQPQQTQQPQQAQQAPKPKYPEKPITLVVPWAVGGMTDRTIRAVVPAAEKELGQPFVVTNMPGASSAIGTQHVYSQAADGYTVLGGAETPPLFGVLDLSPRSYDDFEPVVLLAMAIPVLVTTPDARWKDAKSLIDEAKAKPKQIKLSNTGIGAQPHVAASILKYAMGVEFSQIPFDGGGPALTAVIGKHVDCTIAPATEVMEQVRGGKVKILASFTNDPVPDLGSAPALGEIYPELKRFLPWGGWYGIFVKKGTPQEVIDRLTVAFKKAAEGPDFQKFLKDMVARPLILTGQDAKQFISKWQSVTAWTLHEVGVTKKSPEEFKIPKP